MVSLFGQLDAKILRFAIFSRVVLICLVILSDILPDHNARVFNPAADWNNYTSLDRLVYGLFSGLKKWDAAYFHFISQNGYAFENTLAFFPGLPLLIRITSATLLFPLRFVLHWEIHLLLTGIFVTNACFVVSSYLLFRLSCEILGRTNLAYISALLFCFNPASIFFSALYSESLYAMTSLAGMLSVAYNRPIVAVVMFGLAAGTRSNALLNLGYLGYAGLHLTMGQRTTLTRLLTCLSTAFYMLLASLPFFFYQHYAFVVYCISTTRHYSQMVLNLTSEGNLHLQGAQPVPKWCNTTLGHSYSYIQQVHWGVGFLRYYQLKQLPNFLLCAPVVLLSVMATLSLIKNSPRTVLSLGLQTESPMSKRILPYALHLSFLVIYGLATIHVQVLTRLILSSCPIVFWFIGYLLLDEIRDLPLEPVHQNLIAGDKLDIIQLETSRKSNILIDLLFSYRSLPLIKKLLIIYFVMYFFIGIILHVNFLPWT